MTDDVLTGDVQLLREAVDRLQAAYDRRRVEFVAAIDPMSGVTPEDMRDSSGRSILLDALVAIVNGRAALVAAEQAARRG